MNCWSCKDSEATNETTWSAGPDLRLKEADVFNKAVRVFGNVSCETARATGYAVPATVPWVLICRTFRRYTAAVRRSGLLTAANDA